MLDTIMLASIIAFICYLIIFISFVIPEGKLNKYGISDSSQNTFVHILLFNGIIAHFFSFTPNLYSNTGVSFSFSNTILLSSWIITFLYFLYSFKTPLISIGLIIIPFDIFLLAIYPNTTLKHISQTIEPMIATHIISSMIAFSLIIIAAIQAFSLWMQANILHRHHSNFLLRKLPPYFQMEKVLFNLIDLGLLFLTLALITGFIFLDDIFAQHLVHKTVLSILAWLAFSVLSIGRRIWGWQSKVLIRSTIMASTLLLIGFLGSKFVLERLINS